MTDDQIALADVHLRQLAQMRDIGMRLAANAEADMPQGMKPPAKNAMMSAYAQLTKAIRQIMALEEEIIGLREKRVARLRTAWKQEKAKAVRRSVEKSLTAAKPEMQRITRERLLSDLFRDYNDYSRGSIRDLVADICKTLGIEADLSLMGRAPARRRCHAALRLRLGHPGQWREALHRAPERGRPCLGAFRLAPHRRPRR